MTLDSFDIFVLNSATLAIVWWSLASKNNTIEKLKQQLQWAYQRQVRERALLIQAKAHLRAYAKGLSMLEMSGKDTTVTLRMDTFARDNLYAIVTQLEDMVPDRVLESARPTPQDPSHE